MIAADDIAASNSTSGSDALEAPDTAPVIPTTPAVAVDLQRGFFWASELDHLAPPRWLVQEVIPERGRAVRIGSLFAFSRSRGRRNRSPIARIGVA
jgi:hypothetical protein